MAAWCKWWDKPLEDVEEDAQEVCEHEGRACTLCPYFGEKTAPDVATARPEITAKLSKLTEEHMAPHRDVRYYWAKEVTFDHGTGHSVRVDYLQFKPINNSVSGIEKGSFYAYEIKSSIEDFNSKNGHNMLADYNYYVMPLDVFEAVKHKYPITSAF